MNNDNDITIILENSLIAKWNRSKTRSLGFIALCIALLYSGAFIRRRSYNLSFEFRFWMPTALLLLLVMIISFSKTVTALSITKRRRELSIEYYLLFKKRTRILYFDQFNYVVKESKNQSGKGSEKNTYIKLKPDTGSSFRISDRESGKDSASYKKILAALKDIKNY